MAKAAHLNSLLSKQRQVTAQLQELSEEIAELKKLI